MWGFYNRMLEGYLEKFQKKFTKKQQVTNLVFSYIVWIWLRLLFIQEVGCITFPKMIEVSLHSKHCLMVLSWGLYWNTRDGALGTVVTALTKSADAIKWMVKTSKVFEYASGDEHAHGDSRRLLEGSDEQIIVKFPLNFLINTFPH